MYRLFAGRPPPKLTWFADHSKIETNQVYGEDEVWSVLTIPSLQRHHLHQSFICHAGNDESPVPMTVAVTVEMLCE